MPAALPATRRTTRTRAAVIAAVLVGLLVVTGALRMGERGPFGSSYRHVPLASIGVAVSPDGSRTLIRPGSDLVYLTGSRVAVTDPRLATQEQLAAAAATREWLAAGTVPGEGTEFEDLATDALLDLHALMLDDGAVVAAWSGPWRYAWPRDNAFVAAALAATGHDDDALTVLAFLQSVQSPDGSFHARYLPDGSGPPDDRGLQTDATGWALWGAGAVLQNTADPAERALRTAGLRPLIDRSTDRILALTSGGTQLPPPSPDYWEVSERTTTLGTVAPLLMGLQSAALAYTDLGETARATQARTAADSLAEVVQAEFGPGYGRYPTGRKVGGAEADTAAAFLMEPFMSPLPGVHAAWESTSIALAMPAGGLTPGAGWAKDGISWTPTTTVFALTAAAAGEDDAAVRWLRWVDQHRTPLGSIPEKVLHDGAPAQVAPLAWSSANVLLTLALLD